MASPISFPIHWRVPVGCGYSGFFTEVALGFIPALRSLNVDARLLTGRCDDHWLRAHLDAADAAAYQAAWLDEHSLTSAQASAALAIEHGEPCGIRQWKPNDKARPWRVVARAMSERDVTQREQWCLRGADEVWVPTAWHLERFASAGVPRHTLRVIPEPVDTIFFSPFSSYSGKTSTGKSYSGRLKKLTRTFDGNAAPFVFVSVFKWEWRKGWDLLLDAYWSEFGGSGGNDEKVLLKLKTYLPSWEPGPRDLNEHIERHAQRKFRKSRTKLPTIELLLADITREGMRDLYAHSDAFVLPTRGEGWGLPIAEAMSMGLPAIATNSSGPTAFLTRENSHPLPVHARLREGFAEPSVAELRKAMRKAYEERGEKARERGAKARADMHGKFSREAVGRLVVERLKEMGEEEKLRPHSKRNKKGHHHHHKGRRSRDLKDEMRS